MLSADTLDKEQRTVPDEPFADRRRWRDELHGIRGVAIFLVVAFHIFGQGRVSGGIDIFLAITGFLAVPSLYRRSQSGHGFIPLMTRFGGLARRLLVPMVPVLIAIALVGSYVISLPYQPQMFTELRASALFAENIQLTQSQLSYDAASPDTSALQHLWSTSIQMQFHILMPFVFMLLTIPAAKLKRDPKRALLIILGIITVLSFAYAWWYQGVHQASNYFSSISRLWELTLPGMLGLTVSRFRIRATTRAIMSWTGLLMILSTGFLFDGASVFPGPQALLPVTGLLLFLTAGKTYRNWGADRVVELRPVTFLADISYSLYLWHWPVIIFYLNYFDKSRLGVFDALIVFGISLVLGYLGKKLLEDRAASLSFMQKDTIAVVLGLAVMFSLAASFNHRAQTTQTQIDNMTNELGNAVDTRYPGAAAISQGLDYEHAEPIPHADLALTVRPEVYSYAPGNTTAARGCAIATTDPLTEPITCEFGGDDARYTVVLVGGSHVGQWWPALHKLAAENDWKLILLERGDCQLGLDEAALEPNLNIAEPCQEWNANAIEYIRDEIQPDLIVTLGTSLKFGDTEQIRPSQKAAWEALGDTPLLFVRDNPLLDMNPTQCFKQHFNEGVPEDLESCSLPMEDYGFSSEFNQKHATDHPANSHYINTGALLVEDGKFKPTIGNVFVWRNEGHVSTLYAQTSRSLFEEEIRAFKPEMFKE